MVAGDVYNAMSGDNVELNVQPSAGTEFCITAWAFDNSGNTPLYQSGVTQAYADSAATNYSPSGFANTKMMISNNLWFVIPAGGAGKNTVITGIQIK